jgi:hypothetical protein
MFPQNFQFAAKILIVVLTNASVNENDLQQKQGKGSEDKQKTDKNKDFQHL